jgi:low affinity Fe/Cu permease
VLFDQLMTQKRKEPAFFDRLARGVEHAVGLPVTFGIAVATVIVWGVSGPLFGFSDTWQLVINTGTTIVTFLIVFLIQSTQSRDTRALHLKLDELIRANKEASNALVDSEDMSEDDMKRVKKTFDRLANTTNNEAPASSVAEKVA